MKSSYDVVVIGAGPAGAACGITLQKSGIDHCVLDKATFPRGKTCAGLVTGKALKLIRELFEAEDVDRLFCEKSKTIALYRKEEKLVEAPLARPVQLVNRREFDNALAQRYRELGGELYEGSVICDIDYGANQLHLADGRVTEYKQLIFADGALSMAHKQLKTDKRDLAFGVEAYLPAEQFPTESVDIYFDYLPNGYVWVFPHGDTVCVGLANLYDKGTDYRGLLTSFLKEHGVTPDTSKYIGAFLPYGTVIDQKKLPPNVMLTGDAGGFADPITGEGLYMSMQTGIYAAQAQKANVPKEDYLNRVKRLTRIVRDGKRVQKLFFSPSIQQKLLKKVKGKNRFVSYYFDSQVDDYRFEYREMRELIRAYKNEYHK